MKKNEKKKLDYLKDYRSEEEYHSNISETQQREYDATMWWSEITGNNFQDLRNGKGGVRTKNYNKVSSKADFQTDVGLLDTKTWIVHSEKFWIKRDCIESYIQQNAKILFVMGWGDFNPKWTIINPNEVSFVYTYDLHPKIKKEVYWLETKDFQWKYKETVNKPKITDKKLTLEDLL